MQLQVDAGGRRGKCDLRRACTNGEVGESSTFQPHGINWVTGPNNRKKRQGKKGSGKSIKGRQSAWNLEFGIWNLGWDREGF